MNTLDYSNKLKLVGFTEQQAETLAILQDSEIQNLVTKNDLSCAKKEIIDTIIIKLGGIVVVCTGILGFILKN